MKHAELFRGTHFGRTDFDHIVLDALKKVAQGYHNGSTSHAILVQAGWSTQRGESIVLTESGIDELVALTNELKGSADE